jgi:hypothetical protein
MSYDYDFNTILKSALFKNNCLNKSIDAFNNDCMYAPFTNSKDECELDCTTMNLDFDTKDNDSTNYNYESLIDDKESKEKDWGDGGDGGDGVNGGVGGDGGNGVNGVNGGVGGDGGNGVNGGDSISSNFFMQGSMKDNYKFVDNNFKEIAEKMLLDINCDEDTLNKEVVNYEQKDNNGIINNSNIKKIVHMYTNINKKIDTLRIEINAIHTLESNLQNIIDNLKISNKTNVSINNMEDKFKNNMSNVIKYNTYFKFSVYLKQQKNILEDSIDIEQLNLNAIMYLVMKNKWFETAPNVYTLFNQHLPY